MNQQAVISLPVHRGYTPALYCDVSALIALGPIIPPAPTFGLRDDGVGIFYDKAVNSIMGDPESGKTWIALCVIAEALFQGLSALFLDLDHNGPQAVVSRLKAMGVPEDVLTDPDKFRYAEPETTEDYDLVLKDAATWKPNVVVIDSVGELLPLFGANSNSPDDFTRVFARAIKPFAHTSCVITIDHLAKNSDSRSFGATGTGAKKRAISGTSLRVNVVEAFTPGAGGKAEVTINKDRHGGLRGNSPKGEKEPLAAKFVLRERDGALDWQLYTPDAGEEAVTGAVRQADIDAIAALTPPPATVRDTRERLKWRSERASSAFKKWQEQGSVSLNPGQL